MHQMPRGQKVPLAAEILGSMAGSAEHRVAAPRWRSTNLGYLRDLKYIGYFEAYPDLGSSQPSGSKC